MEALAALRMWDEYICQVRPAELAPAILMDLVHVMRSFREALNHVRPADRVRLQFCWAKLPDVPFPIPT